MESDFPLDMTLLGLGAVWFIAVCVWILLSEEGLYKLVFAGWIFIMLVNPLIMVACEFHWIPFKFCPF